MIRILIFTALLFTASAAKAQCGQDYGREVEGILANLPSLEGERPRLVLVGSSTFRLWRDAQAHFTQFEVVNAGIGGSCFNDLIAYREQLFIETSPEVVALYEGDNDLAAGISEVEILRNAELIVEWFQVRTERRVPIVIVAPKPSPSRMALAPKYRRLNKQLRLLAQRHQLGFVDTWAALCTPEGVPNPEFYQADQLHLNDMGNAALANAMNVVLPKWLRISSLAKSLIAD